MADPTAHPCPPTCPCESAYCVRCDVLVGLAGFLPRKRGDPQSSPSMRAADGYA